MNKRYSVRFNSKTSRWMVWDSYSEKLVRSYPEAGSLSAESLCKYMNNNYKEVQS